MKTPDDDGPEAGKGGTVRSREQQEQRNRKTELRKQVMNGFDHGKYGFGKGRA